MPDILVPDYRSTSQRRTYKTCGQKYLYQYSARWRPVQERAGFVFGKVMHSVAAFAVARNCKQYEWSADMPDAETPEMLFGMLWERVRDRSDVQWTKTRGWDYYKTRGEVLSSIVASELPKRIKDVKFGERKFTYSIPGASPEVAIPDLYAYMVAENGVAGHWTIIDFKTAERPYEPLRICIDEQLSSYQYALESHDPPYPVEQLAFCVMCYGSAPMIQWLVSPPRTRAELDEFAISAVQIDRAIKNGVFYRNDSACFAMGRCEFVP
ncbi:MAG: PD-(D/E)XK nuclease family protein, partial [Thermomicrobium sp.]|nr:PD-(D/E)XK nuclease family protein [Thermomicrobium sp.]